MSNTPDSNRHDETPLDQASLRVEIIIDDDVTAPLPAAGIEQAVRCAAAHRGYRCGEIGVRVTTDPIIHQINRQHLGHDYPTDVISFAYFGEKPTIEGELVISADTARRSALELGWSPGHEFILYVVHGTLHITGLDDQTAQQRAQMRAAERTIMMQLGVDEIIRFGADAAGASVTQRRVWEGQA